MHAIKKEFKFDAAHMLKNHFGKCKNLHGHTYTLVAYFEKTKLLENGSSYDMVIDFYNIKEFINPLIEKLDHSFICDTQDEFQVNLANKLINQGMKVYKINNRTTSENLAKHFYKIIKQKFSSLAKIEIYETLGNSCSYDEN